MAYYFHAFSLMMALILFFTGRYFYRSNGKAWRHIAGYNTKSEAERQQYDEARMCADYGKRIMLWALPFLIGLVLDAVRLGVGAVFECVGFALLLIWHILDMHAKGENRYRKE